MRFARDRVKSAADCQIEGGAARESRWDTFARNPVRRRGRATALLQPFASEELKTQAKGHCAALLTVIPAKAGIQLLASRRGHKSRSWIPAFAGMTGFGEFSGADSRWLHECFNPNSNPQSPAAGCSA